MPNSVNSINPDKWVENYADFLFNYTITRINNHQTAKDLVQETFLAGLKSKQNFKGEASERTWLVAILKRKIIDYYRKINSKKGKAEVRMSFYSEGNKEGDWIAESVPNPWGENIAQKIENNELQKVLEKCISSLPEKYEIAFRLKSIENFETNEICKELDISASNLWVIIHRARIQLRKCLEENWFKK